MDRAPVEQYPGELTDQNRIDDGGCDGAVAEKNLLHARRARDLGIEIDERLAVRKEEWRVGVDLTPDEHVFGRERDLAVAMRHVRSYCRENALLRKIDLRVQIRRAEMT